MPFPFSFFTSSSSSAPSLSLSGTPAGQATLQTAAQLTVAQMSSPSSSSSSTSSSTSQPMSTFISRCPSTSNLLVESIETRKLAFHMDDYDDLEGLPHEKAMIAGATAGVMEHIVMFPIDTIKTRMQTENLRGPHYTSVPNAIKRIIAEEGVGRLYRGFPAIVAGAIPSHAMHFSVYEAVKHSLGGHLPGHHPVENGLAGGLATLAHDAIVTPLDVVKQRLQVYNSSYHGVRDAIRSILREEGVRAFYASYPTTVVMNVPFQIVHFGAYESFKVFFTDEGEEHGPKEEIFAGGLAGACAGLVSTPLDVVKTRLQTQNLDALQKKLEAECPKSPAIYHARHNHHHHHLGARGMIKLIYSQEGLAGFMRGASARVLYFMPSAAICWTTYETMKRVLSDAW